MNRGTVAITTRSFDTRGPAMARLQGSCTIGFINHSGRKLSEADLIPALHDAEGVIAGTEPYNRRVIQALPELRVISRVGSGTDSIDCEAARAKGIRIFTTPEAPVQAVAEHTLALILALCRRLPQYTGSMRRGEEAEFPAMLLSGKTIGIIGYGRIGRRVAGMLSSLGCTILIYDPFIAKENLHMECAESLEDLAGRVDILTLHASPRPDGRAVIDEGILSSCRRGILIVNTARGSLVDEEALASALVDGRVAGAGLDVFSKEPYTGPLLGCTEVIATPHVASMTRETRERMETEAVENLLRGLSLVNR